MLRFLFLAIGCLSLTFALRGQTSAQAPVESSPSSSNSGWQHTGSVRTSLGWRDNVLLSPFAPIERPFGRAEVEAFATRNRNDWQLLSFINGDVLRYFSPPHETAGEQQWFGHGEVRWQHWPAWRMALKADGFLQDAVIDLSETETVRTIAPTQVRGAFATAVTRVSLPLGFAVEPLLQVKRTDYREFPGDYDETKMGGRIEWRPGERFGVTAAWFEHRRAYAERQQINGSGRVLAGTHLRFWQRAAEIKATTAWSWGGEWSAALTAGRLENRDRSSGVFDYNQKRGRLELSCQHGRWKTSFDGEAKRLDYLVQTVVGPNPPARIADNFETSLKIERELTDRWTIFTQHQWERSRSNETGFNYRANTVLAGVQRNF